jgi:hypothetical protein
MIGLGIRQNWGAFSLAGKLWPWRPFARIASALPRAQLRLSHQVFKLGSRILRLDMLFPSQRLRRRSAPPTLEGHNAS